MAQHHPLGDIEYLRENLLQQQESNCKCNDILIHWHRLLRDYSHQDIEKDYR